MTRAGWVAFACALWGGCRASTPTDVASLQARVERSPEDLRARRRLAIHEDAAGRPGAALAHWLAVRQAGGLWREPLSRAERLRVGELVRQRAMSKLARGAPGAVDDLATAAALGAPASAHVWFGARWRAAWAAARAVDARTQAKAIAWLRTLADDAHAPTGADTPAFAWRAGAWRWARSQWAGDPAAWATHVQAADAHEARAAWTWWPPTEDAPPAPAPPAASSSLGVRDPGGAWAPAFVARCADAVARGDLDGQGLRADDGLPHEARPVSWPSLGPIVAAANPVHAIATARGAIVDDVLADVWAGCASLAIGDARAAAAAWRRAADLERTPLVQLGYGLSAVLAGDPDAARLALITAAAISPDGAAPLRDGVQACLVTDQPLCALTFGKLALDLTAPAGQAPMRVQLAEASARLGRVSQAAALGGQPVGAPRALTNTALIAAVQADAAQAPELTRALALAAQAPAGSAHATWARGRLRTIAATGPWRDAMLAAWWLTRPAAVSAATSTAPDR